MLNQRPGRGSTFLGPVRPGAFPAALAVAPLMEGPLGMIVRYSESEQAELSEVA